MQKLWEVSLTPPSDATSFRGLRPPVSLLTFKTCPMFPWQKDVSSDSSVHRLLWLLNMRSSVSESVKSWGSLSHGQWSLSHFLSETLVAVLSAVVASERGVFASAR